MDISQSRPIRAHHNDPFLPVLLDPNTKEAEFTGEQERLVREILLTGASDTRFAQKMGDAIMAVVRAGEDIVLTPPSIDSLSPASGVVGSPLFTLSVNGSDFVEGDVILANGNELTTTFGGNSVLTAEATLEFVVTAQQIPVVVRNSAGVLSNTVQFDVTAARQSNPEKDSKEKRDAVNTVRK